MLNGLQERQLPAKHMEYRCLTVLLFFPLFVTAVLPPNDTVTASEQINIIHSFQSTKHSFHATTVSLYSIFISLCKI